MNRKMLYVIIAVLVICPFFILAFSTYDNVEDLMVPPQLSGEYGKIQNAFEKSIQNKSKIKLKYPSEGEYKNAYVTYDIDGDGQNEVLVFYSLQSDETVVHINLLNKDKHNKWKSVEDISGYGKEIKSIYFEDLNGDNISEILISWSLYENKANKVLTVQDVEISNKEIKGLKTLSKETYSYFDLIDLDSDGKKEIFIADLDFTEENPKSYAKLLKYNSNNEIKSLSKQNLDGAVSAYSSIKIQKSDDKTPAMIFLDAYKGDNEMITEVIYWDSVSKSLKVPLLNQKTTTNIMSARTPPVPSMDIDNDGKIEIPVSKDKRALNDINVNTRYSVSYDIALGITKWCSVENDRLKEKESSLINFNDFYILMIDDSYVNKLNAKINLKTRKLIAYNSDKDDELFSIITVPVNKWKEKPIKGYSMLKRNDSLVYAYKIEKMGEKFGITPEKLASNIKIIK